MTTAENYMIILEGARNASEIKRTLISAKTESIVEEYDDDDNLIGLEFADKSALDISEYVK